MEIIMSTHEQLTNNLASIHTVDNADRLDQLLNETHASGLIGFSVNTLRNWRVSGKGPQFVKISKRAIRYRRRDLNSWAEERLVSSTSEAA
jgi:predicted DNA-binding transcriptional regulator AlpA